MAPHPRPLWHHRTTLIVAAVLLWHGLLLWALQTGLLQRAMQGAQELVVPAEVLLPSLPSPPVAPPPAPAKPAPRAPSTPAAATPTPVSPQPTPVAPAPAAPALAAVEAPPIPNAPSGAVHAAPAAVAAPAPTPRLEPPSSDADYLHNPKPRYPPVSISRNEQGTVHLLVLVGVDGRAKEVKLKASSGFERLDRAAREAVLGWTFVPAKRGGVPEDMWYDLPIPFKLTE